MLTPTNGRLRMHGLYPATVTPFADDMSVDVPALRRHLHDIAGTPGVRGLVVNGGLGELLQLSIEEQQQVIRETLAVRKPGQLVVTGVCANSARQAIEDAQAMKAAGAEALLVFPPFDIRAYRRLTNHTPSVVAFFKELGAAVGLPMIIFQYAPQSGCAYSVETLLAVADAVPQVAAIKATSGSLEAYKPLWDGLQDKLSIMAAVDGPPLIDMLLYGAHGALVGISTIGTHIWVELVAAALEGNRERVLQLHADHCAAIMQHVWENHQPTRATSEVASTKEALVQMGRLPSSRVRAPAVGMTDEVRADIRTGLLKAGLIAEASAATTPA